MAGLVKLRAPLRRKLNAAYKGRRPWCIEIDPEGVVRVWPRRLKPEETSVDAIYDMAMKRRVAAETAAKLKLKKGT